ncbi:hypothetical protein PAAG_02600 [Paracoccidioides lutzii Pb01]|uniref:Peptidyl-tRNA hydrolase n=1 Tax=Paracoccidioides lutzii (strain ATCC MYA-826 / Pb01) TaxID=502779 RepID=C1GVQ5_PARBA|nr:hypothetical protein PAAG_02600 [Paracoccidioides lutzii Pb01]EEH40624.2 hypothetical protein PAAG_02600 [Paracoccidioides lutzii Pb01]
MRLSSTMLLLPVLAAAQDQIPLGERLQGWLSKVKSFIPSATPVLSPTAKSTAVTADTAAGSKAGPKIVNKEVVSIKLANWQSILAPTSEGSAEQWLIYVTGANKTCFGRCAKANKAWEDSIPLLSADASSPSLAKVNCESEGILCSIWSASPPSIWYWQVPSRQLGQPKPATPIHVVRLNATTVDAETIYKIHSEKTWKKNGPYNSIFHPVDGTLAQYGLNVPLGYVLFGLGMVPSWLLMVVISFASRTLMGRRMGPPRPQVAPPAGAAR